MSRKSRSRIKDSIQPPRQLPAARADLVQSRCACGASAGVTGQCSSCAQKKMAAEHRRADETGHAAAAPPIVSDVLRTSGEQLDPETRASMESHFGHRLQRRPRSQRLAGTRVGAGCRCARIHGWQNQRVRDKVIDSVEELP